MLAQITTQGQPIDPESGALTAGWLPFAKSEMILGNGPHGWLWVGGYILVETTAGPRFLFHAEAAAWIRQYHLQSLLAPETHFPQLALALNGSFALIVSLNPEFAQNRSSTVHLLADRCGGSPLFFAEHLQQLTVSDDALILGQGINAGLNKRAALALVAGEWVPGTETLAQGVTQLKPAEWIQSTAEGKVIHRKRTWQFGVVAGSKGNPTTDAQTVLKGLESMADRWSPALLALLAPGEKVGLPLSGGLDSRVLLGLFAPRLEGRLVALAYGNPASEDVLLSREAARRVNVEHRLVPFTDAGFLSLERQKILAQHLGMTTRLTLGDGGLALVEAYGVGGAGPLADVAIFIPGHSGDFLMGSKLSPENSAKSLLELQQSFSANYQEIITPGQFAELLHPELLFLANASEELFSATFSRLQSDPPSTFVQRWVLDELVQRRVLCELALYNRRCRGMLPFFDAELLTTINTLPEEALWNQTAYKAAARLLFSGSLAPLLRLKLQMRPPLVGFGMPPGVRRILNALQRRANPLAFERRYSACPMMSLWKTSPELRKQTLQRIRTSPTIQHLFRPERLQKLLTQRLGGDWQLTTLGVWTLTTVALVGEALEQD